jgi:hypothetical protein
MTTDAFALDDPSVAVTGGLVRMSPTVGKLGADLAKAQAEMEGAAKDATNPHFRSKYADLASIRDACRPLAKFGIAFLQPTRAEGPHVTVTTLLLHSSGEWISADLTLTAGQNTPQAVGSAITYGRRYGLAAMVGIAPEDDDGEAAEPRNATPIAPAPKPSKPAPTSKPPGFDTWWPDLQSTADNGPRALGDAWKKSAPDLKAYAEAHHRKELDNLKAVARTVVERRPPEEAPF